MCASLFSSLRRAVASLPRTLPLHFPPYRRCGRWRNRCHHKEVQSEFQRLFQYKAVGFCEEMLGILVTPAVLWFSLPQCAAGVLAFVRDFTVRVDGVGDVCSLSVFDFARHGNAKYASPVHCPKHRRSNQASRRIGPDTHTRCVLCVLRSVY